MTARPPRPLRALRLLLAMLAVCLLLAAAYVSLGRQLLPLVGDYRAQIEQRLSAELGMPLHIGRLQGTWQGFTPRLLAEDIRLGEGEHPLQVARLRLVPALLDSLMGRELRLAEIQVEGLALSLREDENGGWAFDGLPARRDAGGFSPAQLLDLLQRVQRVTLLDSQLRVQAVGGEPLALSELQATLRSAGDSPRLDLRLQLPDGQPLALRLDAALDAQDWARSRVQAYLSLPATDWARWLPAALSARWKLDELQAGGRLWLDWADAAAQRAVLQLQAPRLRFAGADGQPQQVEQLHGDFYYRREEAGPRLLVDGLGFVHGDVRQEGLQARVEGRDGRWTLGVPTLDLAPLQGLVEGLAPLPEAARTVLTELAPHGRLRNVSASFAPDESGPQRLAFSANLEQVGFSASHGAPAVENLSGSLRGDLGGGELRIDSRDFSLHLDHLFPQAWRYREAHGRLDWTLDDQAFTLIAPYLRVSGEEGELAGDFLIRLYRDPQRESYMDLRVGMRDGDARYTSRYLPSASPAFDPKLDAWLREAIRGGHVEQGYFIYQGSLRHIDPPVSRHLALYFAVDDAELDYQPGWPALRNARGEVRVEGNDVQVDLVHGQVLDSRVGRASAHVGKADAQSPARLSLRAELDSSLADGLHLLQDSPLPTGKIFAGWQGEGALKGNLALDMDLVKGATPQVVVDFSSDGASLDIAKPQLALQDITGDFRYDSRRGLSAPQVSAKVFERDVRGSIQALGGRKAQSLLDFNGQVPLQALLDWGQVKQALPLSGTLPYRLRLWLGDDNRLRVDSNLQGIAIDLPAPFGKPAEQASYADLRMSLGEQPPSYQLDYSDLASLAFHGSLAAPAEGRGELRLGDGPARLPSIGSGLRVRGHLASFDPKAWQPLYTRYFGAGGSGAGDSAKGLLESVDVRVAELPLGSLLLQDAEVQLARAEQAWRLQVDSPQAAGTLLLADAGQAPLQVKLAHLRLPAAKTPAEGVSGSGAERVDPLAQFDPHAIPALDLDIDRLYQGDELLGHWQLKARPDDRGVNFSSVDLQLKGLNLSGRGSWQGTPGSSESRFTGRLSGDDLGDVLLAWGFAPTITSEKFRVDLDGRWPGSPAAFDARRFSGNLDARFDDGQFVEVQGTASALRVFGLLNFESIRRRLRLDFSDLLGRGLSYDRLKARLIAEDGVYRSDEPLTVTGPSTNLEMRGTLDLPADQVDARLRVSVPLTSNLPLAALIVGAPAVGGALFIADKLLGDRVSRLASVQYRVTGSWKDPQMNLEKPFDE